MAANYADLRADIMAADNAGMDGLHLDIMDGHFVPNLTFGPDLVSKIRPYTEVEFDVHLMMTHPSTLIDAFAQAGANSITVHIECDEDISKLASQIKKAACQLGVAIKPKTPLSDIPKNLWQEIDRLLIMSVEPGFGGQGFIDINDKIQSAAEYIKSHNLACDIQVDGGIKDSNAKAVIAAGATNIVAGSFIFQHPTSTQAAMKALRG